MAQASIYLDECVDVEVAVRLAAVGFDTLTARDAGMIGASDEEQLVFAASQGRVLFTHDRNDFTAIAQRWAQSDRNHAGLAYSSLATPSVLSGWLSELFLVYAREEMANCTLSLPLAT